MKHIEAVVSSTSIDAHGHMMSRESLVMTAEDFKTNCIQMGYEHDPRLAPLGRFVDAWVEDLPSGISILKTTGELFEPDDILPNKIGKPVFEKRHPGGPILLTLDMSYDSPEFQDDIRFISTILGSKPQYELKKAVEPLSILALSGTFALGAIATGFFGCIGADAYNLLKDRLKAMLAKQRTRTKEQLLVFEFTVTHKEKSVAVHTIITNPEAVSIDQMFGNTIYELDKIPHDLFAEHHHLSRLVYSYDQGDLLFLYGVREDGYPINFKKCDQSKT